ncbi:chemotaxis sensory transducer [Oscillochloris trichoides DG-6]|uniref:Chemotaxis sensory transducer n=1 Tax=Oscillochloris trichoides DG-6 TaxID=765420 RepID=E1IGH8_9CHLR|nr:methyl-accepting chemotaxis protein [Oscillochloris trichoides]EFO79744.1 chemotaxis sensory transducer [Oscillochloris trichoides DG-6]
MESQLRFEPSSLLKDNVGVMRLLIAVGMVIALIFVLVVGFLRIAAHINDTLVIVSGMIGIAALGCYGGAFWFLQRQRSFQSSQLIFYGMLLSCLLGTAIFGGASGPLSLCFFVPIVSAGLFGRGRDSLLVAIGALCSMAILLLAEQNFGYQPPITSSASMAFAIFSLATVLLSLLAWLSGRDLRTTLTESHARAQELLTKTEQLMEKNIQQIELGSELAAAAAQMQMTSQQQAGGAADQASAVSQVSTTIEELGSTARQIAQASEHVAMAAQQTLENLSSGQSAVDESIQAMERIRGRVQDVSSRVLSLGERSQQIGEIIDLIDDISDETHLLALNAAIEAAGAGEHGRRFAVVAAEVKSLANRTLAAAKEVKGVIAEIRQATSVAVLAAEEGSKAVERGVELAHRAGQVMDSIVMVAERTAQSAAEIGLATAQQQSASEQVVETMREVAEVARQSALGARQMAESAATLTAIADRLHGIVVNDE